MTFRTPAALLGAALLVVPAALLAQDPSGGLPPTNQEIFAPLDLPDPDPVRTAAGVPGPEYWQQEVDYRIRVALDPEEHRITGSETVTYTNRSPHDLPFLWLHLEQNLFAPGSTGSYVNAGSRWRGSFAEGGVEIHEVAVVRDGRRSEVPRRIDGTLMRVELDRPVEARGGTVELEVAWSFVVPEYGADRMGRLATERGTVYELAQWYPRVAVYDDVEGWNTLPYVGQGEFYLEYGDFQVDITVPREMIVVAGGELLNPGTVLTPEQQRRLERARTSSGTVDIVAPDEVGTAASRPAGEGPLTWRFRLERARDFAWAASPAFIWDASGWEGILLQSAYPHEAVGTEERPGWERSTEYLRHSIPFYSELLLRYPYPVAVNVAGVVGGMEYPGIVFCGAGARGQGLFGVTDHEFGHTWFPMIVGSDERRHAWMDEGFNTFINHYSTLAFYGPDAARLARTRADYVAGRMQEPLADQPIATRPDLIRNPALGFLAYRKPAHGLILLREVVLGEERFDDAFRRYVDAWAFRHPRPADFFRSMEEASGTSLDWFWRGWFHSTDVLDQALVAVEPAEEGGTRIVLRNEAGLVMPVLLRVEGEDGEIHDETLPVEVWARSDEVEIFVPLSGPLARVSLDPEGRLPDVDRDDNVWPREVATDGAGGGGAGG